MIHDSSLVASSTIMFRQKKPISFFLFTSILFHIVMLLLIKEGLKSFQAQVQEAPQAVWIALKDSSLPQRIADIERPKEERTPDKASAQALYNQAVTEEVVSPSPPRPSEGQQGEGAKPQQKVESKKDLKEQYAMRIPKQDQKERLPGLPQATQGLGTPAPMDDYFPDYKVGARTYLNTLANPHIRYFVELKQKFKLTFNPVPALSGHINEISRGRIDVVLGVSVNSQGELAELIVIRPSGIESYDFEGRRTVRSSAPFSAPPSHLLQDDGLLHMAWTFIVYL